MKITFSMSLEIELEVEGDYSPAVEGNCSPNSLPENCFPDEGSEFSAERVSVVFRDSHGKEYKRIKCPVEIENEISYDELIEKADETWEAER